MTVFCYQKMQQSHVGATQVQYVFFQEAASEAHEEVSIFCYTEIPFSFFCSVRIEKTSARNCAIV